MLSDARCIATIPALDMARAQRFYTDKLGLKPPLERPDGLLFECGEGAAFLLYESQFAGTAQNTAMGWDVTDFDTVIATLRGNGVEFEQYDFPEFSTDADGIVHLPD